MVATAPTIEPLTAAAQIEKWHGLLLRFAGKYARRYQIDPDEAYQWIVLHILEQWDTYAPSRGAFTTWLHVVVPNAFRDLKRQITMRSVLCVSLSAPAGAGSRDGGRTLGDFVPDLSLPDVGDEVADRTSREEVRAAITRLADPERTVIEKRFFRDEKLSPRDRGILAGAMASLSAMLA
ncbi:MAG: hypothetical protein K8U57_31370 [Planctomycetes bacterium]|nr:hypothetical protein [Planctomycetota bacterium]